MSWIVQRLLMATPRLKENPDFESDEYNNLLIVEKEIISLRKNGLLSDLETAIIGLVAEGYLLSDIAGKIKLSSKTVSKIFELSCNRIAFSLGDEFTDAGFIDEFSYKNKLSREEQDRLEDYIASNKKHTVIRRTIKSNDYKNRPNSF